MYQSNIAPNLCIKVTAPNLCIEVT